MKKMIKSLKKQEGFTRIELMVVIVIIILLVAVAIPNFKVMKFRKHCIKDKIKENICFDYKGKTLCDDVIAGKYCSQLSKEHIGTVYSSDLTCKKCSIKIKEAND